LRAEVLASAAGAASVAETYPAIRHGLRLLGDRHSHFRDPAQTARSRRALAQHGYLAPRRPAGRLVAAGIALLELPGCACRGQATCGPYAEAVQRAIRHLDAAGGRGWIVDLRRNGGGNLWPMLAGIGPVLGEGPCGGFVGPDGHREAWGYAGGASHVAGERECWVAAPYRLRRPAPPVAVLASGRTMSSGELTLLAFRGRPDTRTLGEPTFGVPTSNGSHEFADGSVLYLTEQLGADRTGRTYDGPIAPDDRVPIDWTRLDADDDPVALAAVAWLRGRLG
jgi:C-terminal processing protease CtpA/Prc